MRNFIFILSLLISFLSTGQSNQFYLKVTNGSSVDLLKKNTLISEFYCPFRHKEMQNTYVIRLHQPNTVEALLNSLHPTLRVEYLEEVPRVELFFTPNDLQASQYALSIINATQAWDLNLNASTARIAIIDDAIDLTHPDLSGNIWINSGEIPGDGIDNDFNGFVDDVTGWDFANGDNNPNPPSSILDHGTHVAGIASAGTDNGLGMASIGMNAKIVPIKIGLDATGALTGGEQAIDYAIALGVDVINMSWGGSAYSQTAQDLFNIAYTEGIVCVAAAGNASSSFPFYPAAYNRVISVASTNALDQASSFTNYGPTVDLAAPGSTIYSTLPAGLYGNKSGTSMASPCVAGLVALMRDANPLATVDEIEACLLSTCDLITGPLSSQVGAGRINAYEAMLCITQPTAEFTSNQTQVCPGNSIQFYNYSAWPGTTYSWSFPGGIPATSNLQNPLVTYPTGGTYTVTLTVTNGPFTQTITSTNYVTITQPTASITGVSTIIAGGFGSVSVNLVGTPPFAFTITDGTNNYPVSGVSSSPYVQFFNPSVSTNYSLINLSDSQCNGTTSGLGTINVSPAGTLLCDSSTIAFTKYLGTNVDDVSAGVSDLGQYGFLVMGRKQFSSTNMRMYLCRLDKCGNVLWENIYDPNSYGLPVTAYMVGNEIYIMSYHGPSNTSTRTMLTRLDLNGTVLDSKRISGPNNATYPRFMVHASNGDHLIGTVTNSTPSLGGNDGYIVRTQGNGTIVWQRRFGSSNTEFLHNLYEDNAGNILSCGYLIEGFNSGYVNKFDANGNLLWSKKYNMGSGNTYISQLEELNGFYYVAMRTDVGTYGNFDGALMKLDFNGNIVWTKKIGGTAYDEIQSVKAYNDTLYVLGISASGVPNREVLLSRFDQSGNLLDFGSYGTPVNDAVSGSGQQLEMMADGDWIGVSTGDAGVLGGTDISLFKLNDYTDMCQASAALVQSSSIAMQALNFPVTVQTPNWSFSPISIPVTPVISNQGFACISAVTAPCSVIADFSSSIVVCVNDSVQFTDLTIPNNSADVNSWDFGDGSMSGFVPAGNIAHLYNTAGTYLVEMVAIDTLLGCGDTITHAVTVTTNPSIAVPDTLFACLYDTLQIDLTELCLSAQASVVWSPDSIIVVNYGSDVTIEVNYFGYVYVTVVDNGVTLIDSVYIAESPNCCTSIPIITPPASACFGEPMSFTQNSITNGAPMFNWSFLPDGNPLSWTGSTPPDIIFTTPGQKQVVLSLSDNCGVQTDTLYFSVFNSPLFDLGPDLYFCSDTILQLGDTLIDNWTYAWQPATVVSNTIISNPTANLVSDQTITVIVTDPWTGCSTYDTLTISVDSVDVDLGSDLAFCSDTAMQFGLIPQPNWEYAWSPANSVSNSTIADPIVSLTGTQSVIVNVTNTLNGCTNSDTVEVLIDVVSVDLGSDVAFCNDTSILLGPPPLSAYTYSWEPAAFVSNPVLANPSFMVNGNNTVSVTVTSTLSGCTDSDTIVYSLNGIDVDLGNDLAFCSDTSIQFGLTPQADWEYDWSPVGSVSNSTLADPVVNLTATQAVILNVTNTVTGCSASDTVEVLIDDVTIDLGPDLVFCSDTLLILGPAAIPGYSYSWEPSALVSNPTLANPTFTVTGNDSVSVLITSTLSGCSNSDTVEYSIDAVFIDLLTDDTTLCAPSTFTVVANHSGFTDILWQPAANVNSQTTNSASISATANTTIYATTYSTSGSCSDTDTLLVTFEDIPEAVSIDTLICDDESFLYIPSGTWFSGSQQIGLISLNQEGLYTYSENDACGTIFHQISIGLTPCDCNVYIPNAFTPDGGQYNNTFSVVSDCTFEEYRLLIFNRWGQVIFESFDVTESWDGTYKGRIVQDGTYTWKLSYTDTIRFIETELVGHVTLIR